MILDVLALAGIIFCGFLLRRSSKFLAHWAGTGIIAIFSVYAVYDGFNALHNNIKIFLAYYGEVALKLAVILGVLYALAGRSGRAFERFRTAFLVLSPLFLILSAFNIWAYETNQLRIVGKGKAAGMLPAPAPANRVIWVIFDELDNRLLFQKRLARLQPAEFDRLREESLYAGRVHTPASETLESIPSMLLGQTVLKTKVDTSKLLIKTSEASPWVNFASLPNVFRRARAAGFNTAVSGWHHPYCRIMGQDLSACAWDSSWMDVYFERHLQALSLLPRAASLAHWQSRVNPFLKDKPHFIPPNEVAHMREDNIAALRLIEEHAREMLHNRALNFVLLHYPIPHPPGIWDPVGQKLTTAKADYIDNLQLADRILGSVRHELESMGD